MPHNIRSVSIHSDVNKSKGSSHILQHSRGPQFKAKGGVIVAFFSLGSFLIAIYGLLANQFVISVILLLLSVISFVYTIDIHGFELDALKFRIRDYKRFLWFKFGSWSYIRNYEFVYLTKGRLTIATSDYADHSYDTYYYYFVKLVDEVNHKEIVIAEFNELLKAESLSKKVADSLGIQVKIFIKRAESI